MKAVCLLVALSLCGCASRGVVSKGVSNGANLPTTTGPVCLLPTQPDGVKVVGTVTITKRSYGSVDELLPEAARATRQLGGNALIGYSAAQKFKGPNPFRTVAPTATGTAALLPISAKCTDLGGKEIS